MENNHSQHIYDLCKEHMHAYVLAETKDGLIFDGIITGLDDEHVYFALVRGDLSPSSPQQARGEEDRQFKSGPVYGGYGSHYGPYGGYGSYGGYGPGYYPYYPPRRFERLVLPLAALTAISLLPWY